MGAPQLDLTIKPQEFFKQKVTEALTNQQIQISDDIEFYLVNLLCEFITTNKLDTLNGELKALETPLALMLKEAIEASPTQQLRIYKYLGDTSLYLAGFFQDYFNNKAFDIGYYITLGSSAYTNVATIFRDHHGDENFMSIYGDLATKFPTLVEVVAEVSDMPGSEVKPVDVLSIYHRWTHNNSDRLRRILQRCGITPIPGLSREKQ
jgi:hypothetical protein